MLEVSSTNGWMANRYIEALDIGLQHTNSVKRMSSYKRVVLQSYCSYSRTHLVETLMIFIVLGKHSSLALQKTV
jgi:uncharacterized protein (UPF0264 family)